MRQINITLDLYSIAVSLILIIYLVVKGKWQEKINRCFTLMCVFNTGMLLGDLTNWTCEGFGHPWLPFFLRLGTVFYFGCSAPLLLAFAAYIIVYISPKTKIPGWVWHLAVGLTGLQLLFSILSLWNGAYFTFSRENLYVRGSLYWLSQLVPVLIYGIITAMILRYSRYLERMEVIFLLSYVALPMIAELIQIANYGMALMNTGTTLALLLVFINIQLEREFVISRQEAELAQSRIDIMLSQIQPHFLFNTLTTIRQLCEADPMAAKEAIRDFSHFLRANMNSLTNKTPIPFAQELNHAKHYLNLEQQRFKERLKVVYDIRTTDFSIPPLTLQPIAENAVRHGIIKRLQGGTVTISSFDIKYAYVVTVKDDGIGFDAAVPQNGVGSHVGLVNVKTRLCYMSGGSLKIESSPEDGTLVTITIPKEEKS